MKSVGGLSFCPWPKPISARLARTTKVTLLAGPAACVASLPAWNSFIIAVGGFLGAGEKDVAVPFTAVKGTKRNDKAVARVSTLRHHRTTQDFGRLTSWAGNELLPARFLCIEHRFNRRL
jgi:hypothetical protein